MVLKFLFAITLLGITVLASNAQQVLKGRVFDEKTDSVLAGVTVYNLTKNNHTLSASDGTYSIAAGESDKVIFSSVGYRPDTLKVIYYMFQAGYDVSLSLKTNFLKAVTVLGSFQADSLRRHEEYADVFSKPKEQLKLGNAEQGTLGIAISPFGALSSKEKQKKNLNKLLTMQDEQSFIDYCFSRNYVEKLTGLRGDSLKTFMVLFRPSYEFCRANTRSDMLLYINDKLKLFLKREPALVAPVTPKRKKLF